MTVVEKFFENAARHPDKLAVIFEGEEISYGELRDAVIRLASWFRLRGVAAGDRIVVQAAYCKWYIAACYAAHLCGAVFVPIEKKVTEETLGGVIRRMGAKAVIAGLAPDGVVSLKYQDMEEVLSNVREQPWEFPSEDLAASIMLTSGTTGPQKGAILTQKNLAVNSLIRMRAAAVKENDVGITLRPLNHVACSRVTDIALYIGGTYIFLDGIMRLQKFYEFMEKYSVTSFSLPPSAISALEQLSQNKLHDYADQIDYTYTGSALMREPQRKFLARMLPRSRLYYSYGSSENGTISLHRFDRDVKDICCVGRPCEGVDIKILDNALNEVERGEQGRVAVRSDMNCKGYWDMPGLTESVYHDGYFLTNDTGYMDKDGFLYILGRIDDVINIGGLKVHPSEIENAASAIPGVEECLCVDVPGAVTGSAAKLVVVRKEGANLTASGIRGALTGKLDSYKLPASVEFVSEIVKTATGKPDRKFYRKQKR